MVAATWPAIDYETLPWAGRDLQGLVSRRVRHQHTGPYRAAVVPRIATADLALRADLLAAAEAASHEIARFDAEMGSEIAPFASVLLRSEAAASSQIENLTASAKAIAEAELGESGCRNADQIVANTRAMAAAVRLADVIGAESILAMHRALMDSFEPGMAGRWRREQVWIGGSALGPHLAEFVPPRHERVPAAVDDLVAFANRLDLPVLPQAAIAHAHFEAIHPFPDGNGRTGRALLHAMLLSKGLTRHVTVPVSAGLLVDTGTYFGALRAYQKGDLAPIVERLGEACLVAVTNGRRLVSDLRDLRGAWAERVSARRDSAVWRLIDILLRRPVVNAALVTTELGISVQNAYRPIDQLVRAGVLVEFTDRRRNRAWRAPEVLDLLDDFAARAGRRGSR